MTEIAIVGLGPGGISAAIQLHRYGFKPRIYEQSDLPSLLQNAKLVENFPGYPQGISGPELQAKFREHLAKYEPEIVWEKVESVKKAGRDWLVETKNTDYLYDHVILATGTVPKKLPLIYPEDAVFHEITEIGEEFDKIAIIGSGDAAFDYALNLESRGKHITIVARSSKLKCLDLLYQRARDIDIEIITGATVKQIGSCEPVEVFLDPPGRTLKVDCVLVAIGRDPNLSSIDDETRKKLQEDPESIPGLHLVGDVKNGIFRQVSLAIGDGLRAAMTIWRCEQ